MTDPLDGRIGEALVRRGSERQPRQRRPRAAAARRQRPRSSARSPLPARGTCPSSPASSSATSSGRPRVIVNKSTLEGEALPRMTWGAAQLGVAQGVLDAVADGLIDAGEAAELVAARRRLGRPGRH